jgi:hypothetical protein
MAKLVLRNLTFHAHSQWLTVLFDETFARLQRSLSLRTFLRGPSRYVSLLRLKTNLPDLFSHYSNAEHGSLQCAAALLMDHSHRFDIEPGSFGADCRAIYTVSQHLEAWATSPDSDYCNLSDIDEQDEIECVSELAQFASFDLIAVATEASLLLANDNAKEEINNFLKANVRYLPMR